MAKHNRRSFIEKKGKPAELKQQGVDSRRLSFKSYAAFFHLHYESENTYQIIVIFDIFPIV